MSVKIIPPKFAKKDLLVLYNITHPTLRIWLRRAGLHEFIGRRKFLIQELVLIFQALGRPRLARRAAQRIKDVYFRVNGLLADDVRFREKYNQDLPAQGQDRLPDSEEELDAPPIYELKGREDAAPQRIHDALTRLTITAILLLGQKARKAIEKKKPPKVYRIARPRKLLSKRAQRRA